MNLLFYSAIGRQGKTTHAIGYAQYKGAKLYTNDVQNATKELYGDMFKQGDFVEIGVGEEIEIDDVKPPLFGPILGSWFQVSGDAFRGLDVGGHDYIP